MQLSTALFLAACAVQDGAPREVGFETVERGFYSGLHEPLQAVIRTQEEWKKFWKGKEGGRTPPRDPPEVDFEKDCVIVVALGERATGGYSIGIKRIETRGEEGIRVVVKRGSPRPDVGGVTQATTQPFHIVRTARPGGGVEFVVDPE